MLLKILWKMKHLFQKSKCSIFHNTLKNLNLYPCIKAIIRYECVTKQIFFVFLNLIICCWYSKEPSQWDGSFQYQKQMFKWRDEKIFTIFCSKILFICTFMYGPRHSTKPVFGSLRKTKAQTSLRIPAVWSAPLLFAYWKVASQNLLQTKFHYSSYSFCS